MTGNREQGAGDRKNETNKILFKLKSPPLRPARCTLHTAIIACCLLLLALAGCGGGGSAPSTGTLTVSAQNSSGGSVSAKILLNNEVKGSAPLQITDLSPGTYTLLLQSAGYTDYTSSVVVQSGQTTTVTAAMQTVSVPDGPTFAKQ